MLSFRNFGRTYSLKKSFKFVGLIAIVLGTITSAIGIIYIQKDTESRLNSLKENFSFWLQVGDSFQIERTILNNEITYENIDLRVVSQGGHTFEGRNSFQINDSIGFNLQKGEVFYSSVEKLRNGVNPIGTIIIKRKLPTKVFIAALVGALVLIAIIYFLSMREVFAMGNKLAEPLENLSSELGSFSKSDDLSKIKLDSKIREIYQIKEKLQSLSKRIQVQEVKIKEKEKAQAINKLALQIAHDIKSPLDVLAMVTQSGMANSEEGVELIEMATNRLFNISEDLLASNRKLKEITEITSAVQNIIQEKKVISNNICFTFDSNVDDSIVKMDESNFSRVFSNLLNNAIEAIEDRAGEINIRIEKRNEFVDLEIRDNGKGIPKNILEKILKEHISYGKKKGNGLGLKHAIETIKSVGGTFHILSNPGLGTSTRFSLPVSV